jgi:hypothetical protein
LARGDDFPRHRPALEDDPGQGFRRRNPSHRSPVYLREIRKCIARPEALLPAKLRAYKPRELAESSAACLALICAMLMATLNDWVASIYEDED